MKTFLFAVTQVHVLNLSVFTSYVTSMEAAIVVVVSLYFASALRLIISVPVVLRICRETRGPDLRKSNSGVEENEPEICDMGKMGKNLRKWRTKR